MGSERKERETGRGRGTERETGMETVCRQADCETRTGNCGSDNACHLQGKKTFILSKDQRPGGKRSFSVVIKLLRCNQLNSIWNCEQSMNVNSSGIGNV